jgi:tRNA-dihydrouridine synthase B
MLSSWIPTSPGQPVLALAPMQDVTDLPFWRLMARYGGADVYYTEYFRVHATSQLEKYILRSIEENPTGKPVIAQMIGNDVPALVRTAQELQRLPIVAVDLNLGCPAPVVYRKCAGGGLLREPKRVDAILGALRDAIEPPCRFTVKTRLGFDSPDVFDELLPIFARHGLDLLTVHGRTVAEMYRTTVHYEFIARAVEAMPCPVLANGNVYSAAKAQEILNVTSAAGLMIGRGAIRNPWLFDQIRLSRNAAGSGTAASIAALDSGGAANALDHRGPAGQSRAAVPAAVPGPSAVPRGHDVLAYVRALYDAVCSPDVKESAQVQKMKKYLNYIAAGAEPTGKFLNDIRRVSTRADFFRVCEEFLDHDQPMPLEPFAHAATSSEVEAPGRQNSSHCDPRNYTARP